jgi:hypothetical protein
MKKFLLIKWDVIKKQKKQLEEAAIERKHLSQNLRKLLLNMRALLVISRMHEIFAECRHEREI